MLSLSSVQGRCIDWLAECRLLCFGEPPNCFSSPQVEFLISGVSRYLAQRRYVKPVGLCWGWESCPPELQAQLLEFDRKGGLMFAYRLESRLFELPENYYWQILPDHPSLRFYQLQQF